MPLPLARVLSITDRRGSVRGLLHCGISFQRRTGLGQVCVARLKLDWRCLERFRRLAKSTHPQDQPAYPSLPNAQAPRKPTRYCLAHAAELGARICNVSAFQGFAEHMRQRSLDFHESSRSVRAGIFLKSTYSTKRLASFWSHNPASTPTP